MLENRLESREKAKRRLKWALLALERSYMASNISINYEIEQIYLKMLLGAFNKPQNRINGLVKVQIHVKLALEGQNLS